ncbi:MAG TPA: uroporphyrinogen decarboxylase family protein [Armatimonadota bacterium]|nr:uroporphyrinogen decarboxylase family protein [Armatimonadota bacterium]
MNAERALNAFLRKPTDRIPHGEMISNPDAIQHITGIDPWEKPRSAQKALIERYAIDVWQLPEDDTPIEKIDDSSDTYEDEEGRKQARWGQEKSWHWDWGREFKTIDDVLAYQPLEHMDKRDLEPVGLDLTPSVDELAAQFQETLDKRRKANGNLALAHGGFYNTMFMWPLLTFGWELFLELGAAYPDECERLMKDFSELSRKVFKAWAKTDLEVFSSHDDICFQAGPTFSPAWLRRFIYPYYEEFWGYLKDAGKTVFFVCDGNVDQVADDVIACGADGILSEPYTNWREYARKHPDKILMGDGDNRIIKTGDKDAIYKMVKEMADFGRDLPGYFFCVSNHITYDLPPEGVKHYFDAAELYGRR